MKQLKKLDHTEQTTNDQQEKRQSFKPDILFAESFYTLKPLFHSYFESERSRIDIHQFLKNQWIFDIPVPPPNAPIS